MNDFRDSWSSADDFEVEVSALDTESETDGSFTPLDRQRPSASNAARNRLVISIGALLVALLVLANVPAIHNQTLSLFNGPAMATSTPNTVGAVQLFQPVPQPMPGWEVAGPNFASAVVFAPSDPATGYSCGPQRLAGNLAAPVIVGATPDAGASWETFDTPASAVACQISVNPTNPLDVALLATPCEPCSTSQTTKLYRSFNGGRDWSLWNLPAVGANPPPDLLYAQWIWVGSTLFIAPHQSGGVGYQRLAASVDGKVFVWLNTVGLFATGPANANINELLASSTTLYVKIGFPDCISNCNWFMQSGDGGASWLPFNPLYQGQSVALLATGGDGRTLLGQVVKDAPPDIHLYLRSTDGGATWQMLPPRPDLLIAEVLNETPDGTIYVAFDQDPDSPTGPQGTEASLGIYALAPGATAWQYLEPAPLEDMFIVNWDSAGHPFALWGVVDPDNLSGGLERHQLS